MRKSTLFLIIFSIIAFLYFVMFSTVNKLIQSNSREDGQNLRKNDDNNYMSVEELKNSGYVFTTKDPEIDSIWFPNTTNKVWKKPYDILIVYIDCWHSNYPHPSWNPEYSSYPLYKLECNMSTNWKGIREGGMMIDFFLKFYNNPIASKYIFIHSHDTSWHYKTNVFDRINYIVNTKYYKNNEYGGIFCKYNYFGIDKNDLLNMEGVRPVDDYLKQFKEVKYAIDTQIEEKHMSPCCSTFFITPNIIKSQTFDFYRKLKIHLMNYVIMKSNNNENDDEVFNHNRWAAIWLESMWHQLFNAKRVVFPPKCEVEIEHKEAFDLINNEE